MDETREQKKEKIENEVSEAVNTLHGCSEQLRNIGANESVIRAMEEGIKAITAVKQLIKHT